MRWLTSPRQAVSVSACKDGFPLAEKAGDSPWESQKVQARTPIGSIEPHCKHVFVTGAFCAADASTPVGVNRKKNSTADRRANKNCNKKLPEERIRRAKM